ncbi:tyrosine-type recombinase/integrase [Brevibacillus laterosporus]|uniref:tyrosine-type recombinase/integrase n=1 Tax=Brevibacillus laterosporus TaxID=1465 RepID=UPI0014446169|nr:tyrosine-type recombinase/integrase [Brevibacillus laterosporus]NKQ22768.1 tyrosine-type recombinase/integrase [Brevibacillus laterosporus]WNX33763.1 tyrosine-type recombinase/integrase [Brevibacillus laterosporus]
MGNFQRKEIKVPKEVKNIGTYKNLMRQVNKVGDHIRQGSFETKQRYHEAVSRFSRHLADQFNMQKFVNISDKHLQSYVGYMKEKGLSASTIKTELSAIRMYHDATPFAKHRLSGNEKFDLERRIFGGVDRTWNENEYKGMIGLARKLGRPDVANILTLGREVGLRIHEVTRLDHITASKAIQTGVLHVKGKGGLERDVPLRPVAIEVLSEAIQRVDRGNKLFVDMRNGQKTHQVIGSIQDFIYNHRDKFQTDNKESDMTFHGLRHSYAREEYMQRIEKGGMQKEVARVEVSKLLGHSRDDVTRIYI